MSRGYSPQWLNLREAADAAARAGALVDRLSGQLAGRSRLVVWDLGSGTGAMVRWLAPRLPGPQHWVLVDRDPALLQLAAAAPPHTAAGTPVTLATRPAELASLGAADLAGADPAAADLVAGADLAGADLAGADLVTASALLDLLTEAEVHRLASVCAAAGCPALFTLSVTGEVEFSPADPLDPQLAAAFNAHQRRPAGAGRLLGPDAVAAAVAAFTRHGATVRTLPSPWRLGPDQRELIGAWLPGWVEAACEQQPELAPAAEAYLARRLAAAAAGELAVVVAHQDLLAYPGEPRTGTGP